MLKLRVLTALILIPLVIIGIFYTSEFYFKLITAAIMLLAAWEWSRLSAYKNLLLRFLYIGAQAAILFFISPYFNNDWILQCGLFFWLFLSVYLIWARSKPKLPMITPVLITILGWLIISLCWVSLQRLQLTPIYLLFMLLIVWLSDTAAYISGRLWGRHLLAPTLSPKKTWEGFIIGLLFTLLSAMFIQHFFQELKPTLSQLWLLVLLTNLAAVAGDLFESQLKRLRGLKDSGQLLPGHGGILDRLDSLLAAAPVFTGSLLLLGLIT
ncbi:MAG: phosphatidate cytidylyltransferase [Gammaproteobacteria bacterium]|nr:MAG: phosphatidate cytidylyltransferase [Gammaproteobacteria bacterium]